MKFMFCGRAGNEKEAEARVEAERQASDKAGDEAYE